jgi:hypothetical protein
MEVCRGGRDDDRYAADGYLDGPLRLPTAVEERKAVRSLPLTAAASVRPSISMLSPCVITSLRDRTPPVVLGGAPFRALALISKWATASTLLTRIVLCAPAAGVGCESSTSIGAPGSEAGRNGVALTTIDDEGSWSADGMSTSRNAAVQPATSRDAVAARLRVLRVCIANQPSRRSRV